MLVRRGFFKDLVFLRGRGRGGRRGRGAARLLFVAAEGGLGAELLEDRGGADLIRLSDELVVARARRLVDGGGGVGGLFLGRGLGLERVLALHPLVDFILVLLQLGVALIVPLEAQRRLGFGGQHAVDERADVFELLLDGVRGRERGVEVGLDAVELRLDERLLFFRDLDFLLDAAEHVLCDAGGVHVRTLDQLEEVERRLVLVQQRVLVLQQRVLVLQLRVLVRHLVVGAEELRLGEAARARAPIVLAHVGQIDAKLVLHRPPRITPGGPHSGPASVGVVLARRLRGAAGRGAAAGAPA
mmetsp:Transcript_15099/g.53749  ORF Transcript_15099/g.53749 Transcript_15099/m.53749 type:complete len:300 (-) Transcript_15099:13-912(-)